MYDFLIVGAGLTGATLARCLSNAGRRVLVIDRRDRIGGNCFDEDLDGILVSAHGGHIFHTNSERVWAWVNLYGEWDSYEHRVKAFRNGRYYSFPPNLMTAQQLGLASDVDLALVYRELFYKDFSEKVWGIPYKKITQAILERVPVRSNWDDRYFTDRFQGLPVGGYTAFISKLLYDVPVWLETDFCLDYEYWRSKAIRVIYTGALDELLGGQFGELEYRSLSFEVKWLDVADYQGCPTVNYPARDVPYTVINEWRHYGWRFVGPADRTVITIQTPASVAETGERYYPFGDYDNVERYKKYRGALEPGVIPAGRLGRFQYLNMDQAVAAAIALSERELGAS